MGAHEAAGQHQFTGIARYFNAYTVIGRRNVSYVDKLLNFSSLKVTVTLF